MALVNVRKAHDSPGGADIEARNAYDHVFGYTIINDLTSPTMRADDTFHYRAIHPKPDDPSRIEYIDTWVSYPGRANGTASAAEVDFAVP